MQENIILKTYLVFRHNETHTHTNKHTIHTHTCTHTHLVFKINFPELDFLDSYMIKKSEQEQSTGDMGVSVPQKILTTAKDRQQGSSAHQEIRTTAKNR